MDKVETVGKWKALAGKIQEIAFAMSEEADPNDPGGDGEKVSVKLWAITLLCRSTNNFSGVHVLLDGTLIVEARTLVRCLYENLFRTGFLVAEGYEAVKTWLADYDVSNKAVGVDLLKWTKDHGVEELKEFAQFMEDLKQKDPKKPPKAGMEAQAVAAKLHDHYITYRMLSADAAHPTTRVLSRHARQEADGSLTISGASFWSDDEEELETRSLACIAFLLICVHVNHLVGLGYQEALEAWIAEYSKLYANTLGGTG